MCALRADGRTNAQLRKLVTEQRQLSSASGSASWSTGGTKVIAAIYGPAQAMLRAQLNDRSLIEVVWEIPSGHQRDDALICEMESVLRGVLEACIITTMLPRRALRVCVQVVTDDGSSMSAAVNAASLALLHAGLHMKFVPCCSSVAITHGGDVVVDPTHAECSDALAVMHLVTGGGGDSQIVASFNEVTGICPPETHLLAMRTASQMCTTQLKFIRASLSKRLKAAK